MAEPYEVVEETCYYDHLEPNIYTPTSEQAGRLIKHLPNEELWGKTAGDYVKWFRKLWLTGDPTGWGEDVFTEGCVMLDPVGRTVGAKSAAADFELLFRYFPDLRAEVLSWAENDREILINWRFKISGEWFCPVVDKFCFYKGRVSFRQAYFDPLMLLAYLSRQSGAAPFIDYYQRRFARAIGGAGVLFLPQLIWAMFLGFFRWAPRPLRPPKLEKPELVNGEVVLRWEPVEGALAYRVTRSEDGGKFVTLHGRYKKTTYIDDTVEPDHRYQYAVGSNRCVDPPDSEQVPERRNSSQRPAQPQVLIRHVSDARRDTDVRREVGPSREEPFTVHRIYVRRGESR